MTGQGKYSKLVNYKARRVAFSEKHSLMELLQISALKYIVLFICC